MYVIWRVGYCGITLVSHGRVGSVVLGMTPWREGCMWIWQGESSVVAVWLLMVQVIEFSLGWWVAKVDMLVGGIVWKSWSIKIGWLYSASSFFLSVTTATKRMINKRLECQFCNEWLIELDRSEATILWPGSEFVEINYGIEFLGLMRIWRVHLGYTIIVEVPIQVIRILDGNAKVLIWEATWPDILVQQFVSHLVV